MTTNEDTRDPAGETRNGASRGDLSDAIVGLCDEYGDGMAADVTGALAQHLAGVARSLETLDDRGDMAGVIAANREAAELVRRAAAMLAAVDA